MIGHLICWTVRRLGLDEGAVQFVSWIRKSTGDVPVLRVAV